MATDASPTGPSGAADDADLQFRAAFDYAPIGMSLVSLDGRLIRVNDAICRITGYSAQELTEHEPYAFVHPEDLPLVIDKFSGLGRDYDQILITHRIIRRDGTTAWTEARTTLVRDGEGRPAFVLGQVHDITAYQEALDALARSEALLSAMIDNAPVGLMLSATDGTLLRGNACASDRLGIPIPEVVGRRPEECLPPEVSAQIRRHNERVLEQGMSVTEDITVTRADGETASFEVTRYPIPGADGTIVGIGSFSVDVSERRRAELAIHRAREHAEAIVAAMAEGYALIVAGQIVTVNDSLCEMTGWSRKELVGQSMPFPFWPPGRDAEREAIREHVRKAGSGTFEMELRRRSGSCFAGELTIRPAHNPDGTIIGYVLTFRDISERKRHEAERAQRAEEERALRRIAELVAQAAGPAAVFDEVSQQARDLFDAHSTIVVRFDEARRRGVFVTGATRKAVRLAGSEIDLTGTSAPSGVYRTGQAFRSGGRRTSGLSGEITRVVGDVSDAVAAPVRVGTKIWGCLGVAFSGGPAPADTEERLARFAELTGMAVAHAEAWEALSRQAATDPVTGLANHRTFQERLRAEMRRARRYGRNLSLVLLDVDHFKQINDLYGHQTGDHVLAEVARRLASGAREGELVARVGGEEFAWLLPEADRNGAFQAAERARRAIEATAFADAGKLTISAGICTAEEGYEPDDLVRFADRALYWAKDGGRNLTFVYTEEADRLLSQDDRRVERYQTMASVRALARAIDSKDSSTGQHSERVAELAERIALALGWTAKRARLLHACGLLHDVGKIGIPDAILLKPGRLTEAEYEQIKQHAELSARISSEVLEDEQVTWIRGHHERWDGKGYPDGLAGGEISDGAQILAVADAYDVMTESRTYRLPRSPEDALQECRRHAGGQFSPQVVAALEAVFASLPKPPASEAAPLRAQGA